jgi:hypothetical protein
MLPLRFLGVDLVAVGECWEVFLAGDISPLLGRSRSVGIAAHGAGFKCQYAKRVPEPTESVATWRSPLLGKRCTQQLAAV